MKTRTTTDPANAPETTLLLILDGWDAQAIEEAVALRRSWDILPDGGGNETGRLVAEICRGWMERASRDHPLHLDDA